MAVNFSTQLAVVKEGAFQGPAMSGPLAQALANANSCYRAHKPALLSFCPMMGPAHGRAASFTAGCVPSVDSLRYRVVHVVLPRYNGTLSFTVDSGLGDGPTTWTNLYGPVAVATVNGVWLVHAHYVTVAAGEDRLRFQYTAPGGNFLVSHVLAYPDPDPALVPLVAPYGQMASGFWPADDALLTAVAGGPVHTEMLDRCWRNSVAVLRDRWQCLASFVQEDGLHGAPRHVAPFGSVPAGAGWALVSKARGFLPFQVGTPVAGLDMRPALRVAVQGDVSAGATNARIKVIARGANGKQSEVQFAADGAMHVSQALRAEVDGSADSPLDFDCYVRADVGQTVKLFSAVVHWLPGD